MSSALANGAVAASVVAAIRGAAVTEKPFPHLLLTDIFDPAVMAHLVAALPADETYLRDRSPDSVTGRNPLRTAWRLKLDDDPRTPRDPSGSFRFWVRVADELKAPRVRDAFLAAFREWLPELPDGGAGLKTGVRLYRDDGGSRIGPHTDGPDKLVTCIFYLPTAGEVSGCGTQLLTPRDPAFTPPPDTEYEHSRFYDRADLFDVVDTVPFRPNSAMALARSPWSFHAVEIPDGIRGRYSLMYRLIQR